MLSNRQTVAVDILRCCLRRNGLLMASTWFRRRREIMAATEAANDSAERALQRAELERAQLENEKLRLELAEFRRGRLLSLLSTQMAPISAALIAIASFWWGIVQYQHEQEENRTTETATANQEFMKPWLESQRDTYLHALAAASTVANATDPEQRKQAEDEFRELFQGKMILVETKTVTDKMAYFGRCVRGIGTESCDPYEMNLRCRALATAMAGSMAATAAMTYKQFAANQFQYAAGSQ
jgi:hypothetical protein